MENSKDLLLADFKYISESLQENEQIGERRIKFLITLVTAVLAAVVKLASNDEGLFKVIMNEEYLISLIIIFSLFALLIIGFITLMRMIQRDRVTEEYKRELDLIRQRLKDYFDDDYYLENYAPFVTQKPINFDHPDDEKNKDGKKISTIRRFGGLTHTVSAINSIIFAVLVGSIFASTPFYIVVSIVLVVLTVAFLIQYKFVKKDANEHHNKLYRYDYTHAGGIVYRMKNAIPEFMIITALKGKDQVFPKGHIEKDRGELHKSAALREVLEETGIVAHVLLPVGKICFIEENKDSGGKEYINTKFYLMKYLETVDEKAEERRPKWREFAEAKSLLTYTESKELLVKANRIISSNLNDQF